MGTNDLTIRNGWFARVLRALSLVEVRDDGTTSHVAGADFVSAQPARPDYSALNSMSALAAFPWVRACVDAIASDLTKLPIRAIRGRGANAEPLDGHPAIDLLEQPSSRVSGILLRRQLVSDLVLTGDAFLLIAGSPEPRALIRLHPERVRIIPSADGQPAGYEYDGGGDLTRYEFDQVLHVRQTSWAASPVNLYGTGAIQALHNDLKTDLAASQLAAESATTGLPTGILSPSEEGDRWTKNQIVQLREGFEKQLKAKSGTVILGAGVEYQQLSQTLRDMEYQNTRLMAREAVLAAFGVPPTRVGLPNANYATAMAQGRQYAESLQGKAALIDSALSRLARMFPDSDDVRIVHDFAEVDALQESRTERVNRVQSWYFMGLPLADAAALEGFDELDAAQVDPEPVEVEPEPQTESLIRLMFDDDERIRRAVGDTDPTNFPADGDDDTVSLRNSQWEVFDLKYAERIKTEYPSIWRKGGNIKGGEQYAKLRPLALDGGKVETRSEEEAVRLREAWGARHLEDYRIAGVIAQVKWLVVGSRGEQYMKDLIDEEIAKLETDKAAKWLALDGAETMQMETADGRDAVWRNFIAKVQGPGERRLAALTRKYLRAYGARVAARFEENTPQGKSITKAIDSVTLDKILDEAFEGQEVARVLLPTYRMILERSIREAYRTIDLDEGIDPARIQAAANQEVARMTRQIHATSSDQVAKILEDGFTQGASIADIQANLVQSAAFSPQRAMTIARTEATRLANQGAADGYREAGRLGMKLEKQWLHSRDDKVRESHLDLEAKGWIPMDAPFESRGSLADVPGGFGVGREDINCRCTIVARRVKQ